MKITKIELNQKSKKIIIGEVTLQGVQVTFKRTFCKEHTINAFPTNYGRVGANKEILYYYFCDELGEELSPYYSKQINNYLLNQKLLGLFDNK